MFRHILVPLDGTALGEGTLPYARALATSAGATISLVHPTETPRPWSANYATPSGVGDAIDRYLAGTAAALADDGLTVESHVLRGDARTAVAEALEQADPDLVVLPLPVHAGLGHWVAVAETVLAQSPQPALLVPTWGSAGSRRGFDDAPRFVVPLDGSLEAETALPFAVALARCLRGQIVLLRVVSPAPTALSLSSQDRGWDREVMKQRTGDAADYLERVARDLRFTACPVTVDLRVGWAADAIAQAARDHGAALVLLAGDRPAPGERTPLGRVTRGVLRHGAAPVLLVRASAVPLPHPTRERLGDFARAGLPVPLASRYGGPATNEPAVALSAPLAGPRPLPQVPAALVERRAGRLPDSPSSA
jgi:nucleotide-binding universal stress UspA family protein